MVEKIFSGNLAKHLENNAKEFPSEIAIITDTKPYLKKSFKELHKDVIYCSSYFKKKGLRKNDRTLLMVRPGYDLIVCCFALLYIGAIPIIIDPGMGFKSLLKCIKKIQRYKSNRYKYCSLDVISFQRILQGITTKSAGH